MADAAQEMDDSELLRRYGASRDGAAFALLVRHHLDLVYSAAVRRVGDRHLAEDVTQAVFVILATKPKSAAKSPSLAGWLLTTVRYAAANALRIERRRRRHEAAAAGLAAAESAASDPGAASSNPSDVLVWQEVASRLDDAVLALPAADRAAVLLRYFERRPLADIAAALDLTEGAVKQRLHRAMEKLRKRLNRRGASLAPAGAAGLTTLLAAHAVKAAPATLLGPACAAAADTAAAGAAATGIAKGAMTMMTWTKVKTVAALVAVTTVVGTGTAVTVSRGMATAQGPSVPAAGGVAAAAAMREKAAARVKWAEEVVKHLNARAEAGEAQTPSFIELKTVSLRRLAEARVDAAEDRETQLKAAEECVKQVRESADVLRKRFEAGVDVSRVTVAQGEYHVADAEYFLAKLQARR